MPCIPKDRTVLATPNRRQALLSAAGAGLAGLMPMGTPARGAQQIIRQVPSSGVQVPAVGMGSWLTFDVGRNTTALAQRVAVLRAFFDAGGGLIDSSPMYGTSEEVIGHCLKHLGYPASLFSATKVWTLTQTMGVRQMKVSRQLWGTDRFDLMQIHNLLDWDSHIETLKADKAAGRIGHIGITTSHGRRHGEFARVMQSQPLDFVQFTYNIANREAEQRLLPMAQDLGQAVIINRPFERGGLFRRVRGHPLPDWAAEIDCTSWAQVFLKFIISHPAVTCAIPATSQPGHMIENMAAGTGTLPDQAMRNRMQEFVEGL